MAEESITSIKRKLSHWSLYKFINWATWNKSEPDEHHFSWSTALQVFQSLKMKYYRQKLYLRIIGQKSSFFLMQKSCFLWKDATSAITPIICRFLICWKSHTTVITRKAQIFRAKPDIFSCQGMHFAKIANIRNPTLQKIWMLLNLVKCQVIREHNTLQRNSVKMTQQAHKTSSIPGRFISLLTELWGKNRDPTNPTFPDLGHCRFSTD